jgi:hypothetical protein
MKYQMDKTLACYKLQCGLAIAVPLLSQQKTKITIRTLVLSTLALFSLVWNKYQQSPKEKARTLCSSTPDTPWIGVERE